MSVKIIFNSHNYERLEMDKHGNFASRRYYDMKYLPQAMKSLTRSDESQDLLFALRKAYKLFKVKSFTFVDVKKEN